MPGPPISIVQPTQVAAQPVEADPRSPQALPAGSLAGPRAIGEAAGAGGAGPSATDPGDAATHPETFAAWMSSALRREGLTQEAAARQLGVSVKTVSRWVGGATEPRMRDLRRIQEVFGEVPLP
jgi:DNA-binding XRE family transcriptional regulator